MSKKKKEETNGTYVCPCCEGACRFWLPKRDGRSASPSLRLKECPICRATGKIHVGPVEELPAPEKGSDNLDASDRSDL